MTAKSLDNTLRLKDVIASDEFSLNGKLLDFRSKGRLPIDAGAFLTDQFAVALGQLLCALVPILKR